MEGGEKSQGAGGPKGGGKGHPEGKVVAFEEEKELPIVVVDPLDDKIEKAHIAWGLKPVALVGRPDKFPYEDLKVSEWADHLLRRSPQTDPFNTKNDIGMEQRLAMAKGMLDGCCAEMGAMIPHGLKMEGERDSAAKIALLAIKVSQELVNCLEAVLGKDLAASVTFHHLRPMLGKPKEPLGKQEMDLLTMLAGGDENFEAEENEFLGQNPQYIVPVRGDGEPKGKRQKVAVEEVAYRPRSWQRGQCP